MFHESYVAFVCTCIIFLSVSVLKTNEFIKRVD